MRTESTPGARGPVFCGSTPTPTRTGCASWTGGAAGSCPAGSRRRGGLRGARRGDRGGRGAGLRRDGGTSSYGAGLTRHLASLGMPMRGALPRRGRRGGARGRGSATSRTRRGPPARRCPARKLGTPQEPGRVGRRGALHARGALLGGEGADLGDQHREVAAHHRAGGAQVEVPRHGRAEADGGAPLRALRGARWAPRSERWRTCGRRRATRRSTWSARSRRPWSENCPALLAMYGCGPVSAAKLAVAAGDNRAGCAPRRRSRRYAGPAPSPPRAARP